MLHCGNNIGGQTHKTFEISKKKEEKKAQRKTRGRIFYILLLNSSWFCVHSGCWV